jgi:putative membrane protein
MIAAWVFGLLMLYANWEHLGQQGWMHTKLLLVVVLTGVHHMMVRYVKDFAQDGNVKSARFYRFFNEVPTGIMILVVILVLVRPF